MVKKIYIYNNNILSIIASFAISCSYLMVFFINHTYVDKNLYLLEASFFELDQIEFYLIFGYIFGSFLTLALVGNFNIKKLFSLAIILYFISFFSIISSEFSLRVLSYYFFIYAMMQINILIMIFFFLFNNDIISINNNHYVNNKMHLALFLLALVFIHVIFNSVFFEAIIKAKNSIPISTVIITNLILAAIFLFTFIKKNIFDKDVNFKDYNLLGIINNIEAELLCGFVIFYVILINIDGYQIYEILELFNNIDYRTQLHAIMVGMFLALILMFTLAQVNKYKFSAFCILMTLILFATIKQWGGADDILPDHMGAKLNWSLISLFMTSLFVLNLLTMANKFHDANLLISLSLYALCCVLGGYCGYITIFSTENTIGNYSFLVSICFVLTGLLVYYSYFLIKNNMK